jgi:hypothetical protein
MTSKQFADTIQHRISVLRSLEYRAKRAHALGLRITGWVITEDEAKGLRVWRDCLVSGPDMPRPYAKVRKVIAHRAPMSDATSELAAG